MSSVALAIAKHLSGLRDDLRRSCGGQAATPVKTVGGTSSTAQVAVIDDRVSLAVRGQPRRPGWAVQRNQPRSQRRRDVNRSAVLTDVQIGSVQQRDELAQCGASRQIERAMPHPRDKSRVKRLMFARTGDDDRSLVSKRVRHFQPAIDGPGFPGF